MSIFRISLLKKIFLQGSKRKLWLNTGHYKVLIMHESFICNRKHELINYWTHHKQQFQKNLSVDYPTEQWTLSGKVTSL